MTIYFTNENIEPLKEGPWWKASIIQKTPKEARFVKITFTPTGQFYEKEIPCVDTLSGPYEFEFLDKNKFPLET